MTDQTRSQDTDRLIEEFRLFVDAAAQRAESCLRGFSADTASNESSCDRCPVCMLLSVLRGDRAEVTGKLADQIATLIAALRAAISEEPPQPSDPAPTERTVQHIGVQRVPGSVLGDAVRPEARGC